MGRRAFDAHRNCVPFCRMARRQVEEMSAFQGLLLNGGRTRDRTLDLSRVKAWRALVYTTELL
jgi:hypothetical protein